MSAQETSGAPPDPGAVPAGEPQAAAPPSSPGHEAPTEPEPEPTDSRGGPPAQGSTSRDPERDAAAPGGAAPSMEQLPDLEDTLRDIPMRVGAELGRATLPLAQAVDLGPGVVIELDRAADDPIDLCINGQRFATGQLLLVEGNEWAIRIERVFEVDPVAGYATRQGGFTT